MAKDGLILKKLSAYVASRYAKRFVKPKYRQPEKKELDSFMGDFEAFLNHQQTIQKNIIESHDNHEVVVGDVRKLILAYLRLRMKHSGLTYLESKAALK